MHDTGPVDVAQPLGEAGHQMTQRGGTQRAIPLHVFGEGGTGDEERRHPRVFGLGIRVHHGRGEGAADPSGRSHLLLEPPPELGVLGVLRVYDLDGEPQPGGGPRQMYDAHAAGAEL